MGSRNSMKQNDKRLVKALGAKHIVPMPNLPGGGPLDLLALRAHVAGRLRSSGGRPTDPDWNVQRLVPFRQERWRQLEDLATRLSSDERKVAPLKWRQCLLSVPCRMLADSFIFRLRSLLLEPVF